MGYDIGLTPCGCGIGQTTCGIGQKSCLRSSNNKKQRGGQELGGATSTLGLRLKTNVLYLQFVDIY